MKSSHFILFLAAFSLTICGMWACDGAQPPLNTFTQSENAMKQGDSLKAKFESKPEYYADGFDFPVGKPDGKKYYNAQGFRKNDHLGDDWNGVGGGNTDFGDPIYAIASGYIVESTQYFGGWGNVTRIIHAVKKGDETSWYESLYAHSSQLVAKGGSFVKRGDQIAKIGDAEGNYYAHLHLEIRDSIGMPLGGGYSKIATGYVDPTAFIKAHRPKK